MIIDNWKLIDMLLIKIGGGETINLDYICEDLAELNKIEKIIIVHGASKIRDKVAEKLDHPTKTVISPSGISSVYTDEKALEIFLMVYAGLINKQIVAKMQSFGLNALGLSGVDAKLWTAKSKKDILVQENDKVKLLKNNRTGRVEKINTDLINLILNNNYIPVLCPPAISYEGEIVNVDGDWASAITAKETKVDKLIFLFEAPGLLKDFQDKKSVIKHIDKNKLDDFLQYAEGRMKKKIIGAKRAFEGGVKEIYFGDGRIKNPIVSLLNGHGTIIS